MTSRPDTFDRSVMMSSVMPSLKYSCSGSPLILLKGRTAIAGFSTCSCCAAFLSLHNHVADINADAEFDAVILRHARVSITDAALDIGGAGDRVHYARKLHQHTVAC